MLLSPVCVVARVCICYVLDVATTGGEDEEKEIKEEEEIEDGRTSSMKSGKR